MVVRSICQITDGGGRAVIIRLVKWCSVILLLALASCTQGTASGRDSSLSRWSKKDQDGEKIAEARMLHERGEIDAAISSLSTWVDNNAYQPGHDLAYELIVEWLLQLNRHDEAKRVASYFLSHHEKSPSARRIIDLFKQQGSLPKPSVEQKPIEPETIEEREGGESPMDSVLDQEKLSMKQIDSNSVDDVEYILYDAPLVEVQKIIEQKGALSSLAHARLAMHNFHIGALEESLKHINLAVDKVPHNANDLMHNLKRNIEAIEQPDMKSLGVILPLTGSFAPFGKKVLIAMGLAWSLPVNTADTGMLTVIKDGVRIFFADSKGDAMMAAKAAELLVKSHKVSMIVGDITNEPSLLAAQICQQLNVPMLSLSRHPLMADLGDYVFVINASQSQQIERLVSYAMNTKGHRRFAILFPRHNYGMSLSKMFFDEVLKKGGAITGIEAYDSHETTFSEPVKKLVGKYYLGLRHDAACNKLAPGETVEKCRNAIKPIVDFDAIFIPEFQKLALVIPALMQEDLLITNSPRAKAALISATKIENPFYIQLLGANSWNDQATLDKIAAHINGAYFVDSMSFENSVELKQFAASFLLASGQAPTTLEVFAHDAALLSVKLLSGENNLKTRRELKEKMASFNGRVGLLDKISFIKNGELDAPEIGFEIIDGKAQVVMPSANKSPPSL